MAAISLTSIVQKNFQLLIPPQSLGLWFSECQQKWKISASHYEKNYVDRNGISVDNGDANFLFSEFSIDSFSPITYPRLHFNIYVWLHLKHLCVVIYAWFTSHLCVALHFLIFLVILGMAMILAVFKLEA